MLRSVEGIETGIGQDREPELRISRSARIPATTRPSRSQETKSHLRDHTVYRRATGIAALFSGAALLTHIVSGLSLRLAFGMSVGILVVALSSVWLSAGAGQRRRLTTFMKAGATSAVIATIAYDSSKFFLSQWDASPYNPFEAIAIFGVLLAGESAHQAQVYLVGTAFHVLNGVSFGVAYCLLFGKRGVLAGIAWGLFLETFQLTLYPGWLDVRFYREFVQISAISHVVYGAVLALACQHFLGQDREKRGT